MSTEVAVRASPADPLDSLIEESSDTEEATPPGPDASPSVYKHRRANPYRMSAVIKLEYDLSHPVYQCIKNLVLKYVLRWFLPNSKESKDQSGGVGARRSLYYLPPPVLASDPSRDTGAGLMRQMWFTSRDNVSLLLEICRQGFSAHTDPAHMRLLVDLYWQWNQVRVWPLGSNCLIL